MQCFALPTHMLLLSALLFTFAPHARHAQSTGLYSRSLSTAVRGIPAVRSPNARSLIRVAFSYLSMAKAALKQTDIHEARAHAFAAHAIASTLSASDLMTSRNGDSDSDCHPIGIAAAAVLSDTFMAEGRFDDALGYAEQVAEHDAAVLGANHPVAIHSMISLAATLASTGSAAEAEQLLCQASDDLCQLSGFEASADRAATSPDGFGVDASIALDAFAHLGEVLLDRGLHAATEPPLRYTDALEVQGKLLENADLLRDAFGRGHPGAIRVSARLRGVHEAAGSLR